MAVGDYSGYWVQQGYEPPDQTPLGNYTANKYHGFHNMTVTNWDGEEGYLIIRMLTLEIPVTSQARACSETGVLLRS